ncbi:hypothetical protein TSTA_046360 [Talaromyces stipitatus ATCC 10500]|uniref:Heterokaryon incompatibility domain-containing protein n=1 Tax=Talaromyces stipitatus (strain ATCC 10500 / CBS 375.48 / QM 6759 / NRRL 1006) TaxID=441959 RepID=B8MJI2_TALSN|nr:uncharacterized protein TSTA_046360 [Talaromyces stipitatus ATCC 10500]EED15182.1 hypothetical protein TSTA_046360 [Talaromyces stipitatus ATCC 10500]
MKTFRLINTISWTVETFQIGKSPPYLAISYAWSDNIFPEKLPLNGSFGGDAFAQTIQKRGLTPVKYSWVDRYCIIQDSDDDMNEQIPLMSQIFGNAKAVLIILTTELNLKQKEVDYGTIQLDEALTVWREEAWTNAEAREYWEFGEGRTKLVRAMDILSRFTKAAWGTRVWTLQEYILATNVLWIDQFGIIERTVRGESLVNEYELLFSHFSGMAAFRTAATSRNSERDQTRVLEMLGNRQAFLLVDEVYGIMAASTVEIIVQPKESRESAWKRWLEAALTAGHLRWLMLPPGMLLTEEAYLSPQDKSGLALFFPPMDSVPKVTLWPLTVTRGVKTDGTGSSYVRDQTRNKNKQTVHLSSGTKQELQPQ